MNTEKLNEVIELIESQWGHGESQHNPNMLRALRLLKEFKEEETKPVWDEAWQLRPDAS